MHPGLTSLLPLVAVALLDCQNLLALSRRRVLTPATADRLRDVTVLIPLYGSVSYFADRALLARAGYQPHVLVCTANLPDADVQQLRREGWRVAVFAPERPTAPLLLKLALDAGLVSTPYTARLDADTVLPAGFGHVVAAAAADGADLVSVKCQVLEPRNLLERLQAVEYRMSMRGRHFRPWLVSGACYLGTTAALTAVLNRHTLWFLAEDSEVGRVAWQLRLRIRHVEFAVYTRAPSTPRAWLRQRGKIWWAGNFRHVFVNLDHNLLRMPLWTLYYLALAWLGVTWKWSALLSVFDSWPRALIFLAVMMGLWELLTFTSNWPVRSRWMLLIPLYSFIQSTVCPPLGLLSYARYALAERRLGRYRVTHARRALLPPSPLREVTS